MVMQNKNEVEQSGVALVPVEGLPENLERGVLPGSCDGVMRSHPVVPCTIKDGSTHGIIRISRNAITLVSKVSMSVAQINLLFAIIESIKGYLEFGSAYPFHDSSEVETQIHWDVVSSRHSPKETLKALIQMMDMKIVYYYNFRGMGRTGVANIVSSVEYGDGYYYVRIPSKALPWYLFCGQGVGFGKIERHVLLALRSVPEKLLYLKVMTLVDKEQQVGFWEASASELRNIMNLGAGTSISRMMSRIIQPLVRDMKTLHSLYCLEATPVKDYNHKGKGRPSVTGVRLTIVKNQKHLDDPYETALSLLRICYERWTISGKGEVLPANMILDEIEKGVHLDEFSDKCQRISERIRKEIEKKGADDERKYRLRMANTVAKILREDYGIEVFRH